MKRRCSPRKKYANGSTVGVGSNNYIQDPAEALANYNIMLAQAEQKALSNPLLPIVSTVGAVGQSLIGSGFIGSTFGKVDKPMKTNANGNSNVDEDVELEGGEVIQTPGGQVEELKGPSHENGGIPMEVNKDIPQGTKVYSDRLMVGNKTLAERKAIRERQTANIEKSVAKGADLAMKNAAQRKMMAIQKEEQSDLQHQEMINNMQQMADTMVKAFGTGVAGLQGDTVQENGVGNSMKYKWGGIVEPKTDAEIRLFQKENGLTVDGVFGPKSKAMFVNQSVPDYSDSNEIVAPVYTTAQTDEKAAKQDFIYDSNPMHDRALNYVAPKDTTKTSVKTPSTLSNLAVPAIGDLTQFIGDYLGGTAGLKNAAESRSTDVAHENVYANAGKEAQKYLGEAKAGINAQKEQAILRTTSQGAAGKKGARGTSRGVNQMRATDWLYDTALQSSIAEISAKAAEQLTALSSSQAQMSMNADQLKGQGEYQANMANEAAKDAYYTAKGLGLKDQASAVQMAGKNMNDMKQNEIIANIMKNYGSWVGIDGKGIMTNKK